MIHRDLLLAVAVVALLLPARAPAELAPPDVALAANYDQVGSCEPQSYSDGATSMMAGACYSGCGGTTPCCEEPCDCNDAAAPSRWRLLGHDRLGLLSCDPPCADRWPRCGLYIYQGYDSWRGPSEGSRPGNNGASAAINFGAPLGPSLGDAGLGLQFGTSLGFYDLSGRVAAANQEMQVQQFFTYGVFRRASADRPFSWGVVQDWMINTNFGELADGNVLSQWRAQGAIAINAKNEVGMLGMLRNRGATSTVTGAYYRAVNQINLFYHRKFDTLGADGWFYIGAPESFRLNQGPGFGGSLGASIFATTFNIPLNDQLAIYANWAYMAPSSSTRNAVAALDEVWNVSFGISFYPGGTARASTVAGRKFMPYMPMANNGNFFVDTSTQL